ncbi:MAG TPA: YbaB/EbfC family nucleoid-associated protein [Rhizomicrobium sp.]|jgi:DNA-binding YbaB/EbfC family protein|nr:YbaB/EbfC family nucleoid-associated protein [Rhizomicrobium sp.]
MDLVNLLKQAKDVQSRMKAMQDHVSTMEAEGSAGAGLVRMTLNGKSELRQVAIDPSLLNPDNRQMVADLVVAAHADAKAKVEQLVAEEMQKVAREMGLPPGLGLG